MLSAILVFLGLYTYHFNLCSILTWPSSIFPCIFSLLREHSLLNLRITIGFKTHDNPDYCTLDPFFNYIFKDSIPNKVPL